MVSFAEQQEQWSAPPVDDIGYIHSRDLLKMPADEFLRLIHRAELNRYGGWRNYDGRWRSVLKLDDTYGKRVMDYGCGIGIEALQYARSGNDISVADIAVDNVRVALRTLALEGFAEVGAFYIGDSGHWNDLFAHFDVIHCCGVLHHIPQPKVTMAQFAASLNPGGEVRLMLYSDKAWRVATGSEPPERVEEHPNFERYWRHWDAHGGYADWYNLERLESRFGEWFKVEEYAPLTEDGEYVGAILVKR